ncbi:MAG: epoxyqueuosine reductase QueH [Pseudomonadota bacterium]
MVYDVLMRQKLLLHCCCGPCSAYPFSILSADFDTFAFFSNSNIDTKKEYEKRLNSFARLCRAMNIPYETDTYAPELWLDAVKGLENEPERGKRCAACFNFRLKRTFEFAKINNIKYITTTLSVAPQKDSEMIFGVGRELTKEHGGCFLELNFKKSDGYKKSRLIAKEHQLYIQDHCGCSFSIEQKNKREERNETY